MLHRAADLGADLKSLDGRRHPGAGARLHRGARPGSPRSTPCSRTPGASLSVPSTEPSAPEVAEKPATAAAEEPEVVATEDTEVTPQTDEAEQAEQTEQTGGRQLGSLFRTEGGA
ncbi:hypothetical protein G5V59_17225 [Nocardioides sp. W3-2-3]|nr:hypothetical protein [Nocardioides convexus]